MSRRGQAGESIVEVLIALVVFSVVATGLAQTLVVGLQARRTSGYWMEATQLAVERVEQIRSGDTGVAREVLGRFERSVRSRESVGSLPLERIDVTVEWHDDGPKDFTLSFLRRATP